MCVILLTTCSLLAPSPPRYVQAELVHCRLVMLAVAGIIYTGVSQAQLLLLVLLLLPPRGSP